MPASRSSAPCERVVEHASSPHVLTAPSELHAPAKMRTTVSKFEPNVSKYTTSSAGSVNW